MSEGSIELKDRVFDLMELTPLDEEVLTLNSANLSNSEIAEKTIFTEEEVEERLEENQHQIETLNIDYVGDLSKLDWRQIQEFDIIELTNLSITAERVLAYDMNVVSSAEMSKVINERYKKFLTPKQTGKNLRRLGEEVLEKEEYLENYLRQGVENQWRTGYLKKNYREDILDLIDSNLSRNDYKFDFEGKKEVNTTDEEVADAYNHKIPDQINDESVEDLYDYLVDNNPDLEVLNKQLKKKPPKKFLQVSKVTENNGDGWAPEANFPYKVDVDDEKVYGKRAILKSVGGSRTPYKIEKIIDEQKQK